MLFVEFSGKNVINETSNFIGLIIENFIKIRYLSDLVGIKKKTIKKPGHLAVVRFFAHPYFQNKNVSDHQ